MKYSHVFTDGYSRFHKIASVDVCAFNENNKLIHWRYNIITMQSVELFFHPTFNSIQKMYIYLRPIRLQSKHFIILQHNATCIKQNYFLIIKKNSFNKVVPWLQLCPSFKTFLYKEFCFAIEDSLTSRHLNLNLKIIFLILNSLFSST